MAYTIDQLKEFWSENWRFDNCLGLSKLAVLFPNELRQEGAQMNSIVKIPVMTEAVTQKDWSQETGFIENNSHEKIVEMKLSENFTLYTKIDAVNIPGPNWAANKMMTIERQEAKAYDDHALKTICNGVKNTIPFQEVTKDNFIEVFKKIEKQAKKDKWLISDGLLLISPKIATLVAQSKLNQLTQSLENTSIIINTILNKYNCVECDVDEYGYDIVALLPSAYVWASYVQTPLQSGTYTQGPFLGQVFTVINKWYNGEIIQEDKILGFKNTKETTQNNA
ncbi:hypothetical protein [Spiroplasma endosymbiont of Diplazon laetatorius]|uniref:hypothetical protein n=1 Tax=Spiroplasma endosymbiont of Diplazon laetatorius TaxID=3066322 RepID=UPI0030CE7A84